MTRNTDNSSDWIAIPTPVGERKIFLNRPVLLCSYYSGSVIIQDESWIVSLDPPEKARRMFPNQQMVVTAEERPEVITDLLQNDVSNRVNYYNEKVRNHPE